MGVFQDGTTTRHLVIDVIQHAVGRRPHADGPRAKQGPSKGEAEDFATTLT